MTACTWLLSTAYPLVITAGVLLEYSVLTWWEGIGGTCFRVWVFTSWRKTCRAFRRPPNVDSDVDPQGVLSTRAGCEAPESEASVEQYPARTYLAGAGHPHCAAPARYPHTPVVMAVPRPVTSTGLHSPPSPQTPAGAGGDPQAAAPAGPNPLRRTTP